MVLASPFVCAANSPNIPTSPSVRGVNSSVHAASPSKLATNSSKIPASPSNHAANSSVGAANGANLTGARGGNGHNYDKYAGKQRPRAVIAQKESVDGCKNVTKHGNSFLGIL